MLIEENPAPESTRIPMFREDLSNNFESYRSSKKMLDHGFLV
jgi:hypothetical protein